MMPETARFTHRLTYATGALARQRAAAVAVRARAADARVIVLGPTPEAGSRVLRRAVEGAPGAFGYQRVTARELAARLAAVGLARAGLAQVSHVALEAVCARRVEQLRQQGALGRFAPVGERPGLPRALARTFGELGLAGVRADHPALEPDLRRLYEGYRGELAAHGLADTSDVLGAATARAEEDSPHALLDRPLVLIDAPVRHALEARLIAALAARAPMCAIVPAGDEATLARLARALDVEPEPLEEPPPDRGLDRLRTQLFGDVAAAGPIDDSVEVLSAPGESRECVEIARRVLSAAREGVAFDRMAVLTHAPERYRAHLVEALSRARIPAHFSRGTVRPDPSGRALLALLACREEGLSARAFGEYLSLGVVPDDEEGAPPPADRQVPWSAPDPEIAPVPALGEAAPPEAEEPVRTDGAVVGGTLRAPWRWERLLVDATVVGGVERWRRRLDRLGSSLRLRLEGLEDVDDPRHQTLARRLRDLDHLRDFALPLIEALAALPGQATWGEWASHLTALATRALRDPAHALSVLRELKPMGPIGPVGLSEVRLVLGRRLTEMYAAPSGAPAGKLYVGSTAEARGLSFAIVFVPGLAERVFPRKIIEDPILLDSARERLDGELATSASKVADERLALRLAVGAAEDRVVLSYPRMDTERGRPRVPSFYGLEVVRAIEGALPTFEQLATRAEEASGTRVAWPAPERPDDAIDEAEYDLAVLRELLDAGKIGEAEGGARYLVEANEHLRRALRQRWMRWDSPKWTTQDGLVSQLTPVTEALEAHRPARRPYSPTALEQLAACPYRFYLRAIVGLAPADRPEAIETIDPLSRGLLIHAIQFALLAELRDRGALPVTEARLEEARALLDEVVDAQAARFAEELAPAIERVWRDAVADVRADLAEWLERMSERPDWVPVGFELAFGLPRDGRHDPASVEDPVTLTEGLTLRGSIDLVERKDGALRATDHKTGAVRGARGVIDGGRVLQPVLYARVLEELHPGEEVVGGRLYFCTARGGFEQRAVRLDAQAREAIGKVAQTLDALVSRAFLPAAPEPRACRHCDYRPVCGPAEERRTRRKQAKPLSALSRLRKQP